MQKQLDTLLQREMTRKEFMATVGFGAASVLGLGTLLKLVNTGAAGRPTGRSNIKNGYGSRAYGR